MLFLNANPKEKVWDHLIKKYCDSWLINMSVSQELFEVLFIACGCFLNEDFAYKETSYNMLTDWPLTPFQLHLALYVEWFVDLIGWN